MKIRIQLNGEIKEVEVRIKQGHPSGYCIVGYELIHRNGKKQTEEEQLDGERIVNLKFYKTLKQTEDDLREWERNPQAIKDTLVKVIV